MVKETVSGCKSCIICTVSKRVADQWEGSKGLARDIDYYGCWIRQEAYKRIDVSADKCGWDVTARVSLGDGRYGLDRHIEVKGRAKGQDTITVTRNEMLYGLNQRDKFILAIVIVDGNEVDGPYYIRHPFQERLDWAEVSKNLDVRLFKHLQLQMKF